MESNEKNYAVPAPARGGSAFGGKAGSYILLFFLCGCAAVPSEQKGAYAQGYRAGVKEQMAAIAAKFQGGNFPYYHWAAPIVQEVLVPAHIEQGVFIPEHRELVIIKPGEWVKSPAYPIATQESKSHEQNSNADMSDITFVPTSARKQQ